MTSKFHYWNKIGFILTTFLGIYAATCWLVPEPLFGIRQNLSDSLPFSFFISTKIQEIKPKMFVSFDHPESPIPLAKQIIGLPGDRIFIKNHTLYINDVDYGPIQEKTRSGLSIHPIEEGEIPEGYLFVYATHPYSFDSRYREFGLVQISNVKERLWPLF
jgi:conjugal transfer pilin signal peptidase TrbI